MQNPFLLSALVLAAALSLSSCGSETGNTVAAENEDGYIELFNGKNLEGWTTSDENPESFSVNEGTLVVKGGKSHLFYTGSVNG